MSGNTREGAELGGLPGAGTGIGTGTVSRSTQPCTVLYSGFSFFILQMAVVLCLRHHSRAFVIAQHSCFTCI